MNRCNSKIIASFFTAISGILLSGCFLTRILEPSTFESKMVYIEGGQFDMGNVISDWDGVNDAPLKLVNISNFYIDRTEVSNKEYRRFLLELAEEDSSKARRLWPNLEDWINNPDLRNYFTDGRFDDYPVVGITWEAAMAYAERYGKRLPKEAEWEYAARGGLVKQNYPWGNDIRCWRKELCANFRSSDDGYTYAAPVKSFIRNNYGLYNMAGNVAEWCLDYYDVNAYRKTGPNDPYLDKTNSSDTLAVVRGGHWGNRPEYISCGVRSSHTPFKSSVYIGFRCVRPVGNQ